MLPEFKYIVVLRRDWTTEEMDSLNIQFKGEAKWIYGD